MRGVTSGGWTAHDSLARGSDAVRSGADHDRQLTLASLERLTQMLDINTGELFTRPARAVTSGSAAGRRATDAGQDGDRDVVKLQAALLAHGGVLTRDDLADALDWDLPAVGARAWCPARPAAANRATPGPQPGRKGGAVVTPTSAAGTAARSVASSITLMRERSLHSSHSLRLGRLAGTRQPQPPGADGEHASRAARHDVVSPLCLCRLILIGDKTIGEGRRPSPQRNATREPPWRRPEANTRTGIQPLTSCCAITDTGAARSTDTTLLSCLTRSGPPSPR
jgi:hypothetical protein